MTCLARGSRRLRALLCLSALTAACQPQWPEPGPETLLALPATNGEEQAPPVPATTRIEVVQAADEAPSEGGAVVALDDVLELDHDIWWDDDAAHVPRPPFSLPSRAHERLAARTRLLDPSRARFATKSPR